MAIACGAFGAEEVFMLELLDAGSEVDIVGSFHGYFLARLAMYIFIHENRREGTYWVVQVEDICDCNW